MDASSLRKEYTSAGLDKADVDHDPIVQFHQWFENAVEADLHEPNAMIVATATTGGKPSARTVLLKGYDERGFVFYTNYGGRKAGEQGMNVIWSSRASSPGFGAFCLPWRKGRSTRCVPTARPSSMC